MLYAVGTHIDLGYLNKTVVKPETPKPSVGRLVDVGTRFLFVKVLAGEGTIIKLQPAAA